MMASAEILIFLKYVISGLYSKLFRGMVAKNQIFFFNFSGSEFLSEKQIASANVLLTTLYVIPGLYSKLSCGIGAKHHFSGRTFADGFGCFQLLFEKL